MKQKWFIGLTIDVTMGNVEEHADLFQRISCSSMYENEGTTEIIWYLEGFKYSSMELLEYCVIELKRNLNKKFNIIDIKVMTEKARMTQLESKGKYDHSFDDIMSQVSKSMNDPSSWVKRERPRKKSG